MRVFVDELIARVGEGSEPTVGLGLLQGTRHLLERSRVKQLFLSLGGLGLLLQHLALKGAAFLS